MPPQRTVSERNVGGRPRLPDAERRYRIVSFRLTSSEEGLLMRMMTKCDMNERDTILKALKALEWVSRR